MPDNTKYIGNKQQADAEEIVRLLTSSTIRPWHFREKSSTIRPLHFREIPLDQVVTYVNPVCVEKLNDDSSLKFRTRLTIGGDRIIYPYDKSAVTADLESFKILLNCMISENANWSTIDLMDKKGQEQSKARDKKPKVKSKPSAKSYVGGKRQEARDKRQGTRGKKRTLDTKKKEARHQKNNTTNDNRVEKIYSQCKIFLKTKFVR